MQTANKRHGGSAHSSGHSPRYPCSQRWDLYVVGPVLAGGCRSEEALLGVLLSPAFFQTVAVMGVIASTVVLSLAGRLKAYYCAILRV